MMSGVATWTCWPATWSPRRCSSSPVSSRPCVPCRRSARGARWVSRGPGAGGARACRGRRARGSAASSPAAARSVGPRPLCRRRLRRFCSLRGGRPRARRAGCVVRVLRARRHPAEHHAPRVSTSPRWSQRQVSRGSRGRLARRGLTPAGCGHPVGSSTAVCACLAYAAFRTLVVVRGPRGSGRRGEAGDYPSRSRSRSNTTVSRAGGGGGGGGGRRRRLRGRCVRSRS